MKISFYQFCLILVMFLMISCVDDVKTDDPSIEKDYMEFSTSVIGFSGVCFSKDKNSLLVASDKLGIYELNFDGSTKRQLKYSGHNDFEGITINPTTGTIYLADETNMTLNQLSEDEIGITQITKIEISNGISNKGIEGVTFGNDTLYAVNQTEPTAVSSYIVGIAGALFVFLWRGAAEPIVFDIPLSFRVLFIAIIGGLGSVLGNFLGAILIVALPVVLGTLPAALGLPIASATAEHLNVMIIGALIILFLIVEPHGLARFWAIIREKLIMWPFPH